MATDRPLESVMRDSVPAILVVEDEPFLLMTTADYLAGYGFKVLEAANADEALLFLDTVPDIQLIFTDIEMPGSMDGLKLAAVVSDLWPPIRIIVTSGHRVIPSQQLPDALFIGKPYSLPELSGQIERLIAA